VYQAREKGTEVNESEAMTKVTAFLHTLGKANGKYISVCEKTTDDENKATVLFDTLVYHSFRDRIYTKSNDLANLESEKSKASKAKAEAHKKLVEGKGTAKDYKEAVKAYNEAVKKVQEGRKQAEAEGEMTEKEALSKFVKFATNRLKAIVKNRYAISEEEAQALRKLHNKETKEKRNNGKKPEAEAKKPEAVMETPKPEANPEAEKKTA
jgi:chromosome segregation ATPase